MKHLTFSLLCALALLASCKKAQEIPLPEHPRPDFQRAEFINLNGYWDFTFFCTDQGEPAFAYRINVPFPWGSELSGVPDLGDVAWYGRDIKVPKSWEGKRVFLVVGASDYLTTASIDNTLLGVHRGGYTPFEFELTNSVTFGGSNRITLMVDDTASDAHLYGKQGYGNARGIWQTVYLEARGEQYISSLHFSPDVDNQKVKVDVAFDGSVPSDAELAIKFKNGEYEDKVVAVSGDAASFDIDLPGQQLWDLDNPYLYEVCASLKSGGKSVDAVDSYFGQRKISTMKVPGQEYQYIALNNKPLYLKLCLDQSYTPDGFYTFPSDEFMKNEILISKNLALSGNRVHIKVEVPRKLYWADKLGLLIMADVPNFWGEPVGEAREDWENCMRAQVERDYNHPSIFAWVDFNETWGLFSKVDGKKQYMPETQEWVRSMYELTKSLDPTRLVEDNSACNNDHVATDINSWHSYNAAYDWERTAALYDEKTYPGSDFNFIGGNVQGNQPMINSECGNVWGYERSAGDCDFTWDYHEMMNAFHRHLKIGGWLYTEHHDVINEWNGYVQYNRAAKVDGLDYFVPDMTLKDFHSDYYVVPEGPFCQEIPAGSVQNIKLMSAFTTVDDPGKLTLEASFYMWNEYGKKVEYGSQNYAVDFKPFELSEIGSESVPFPNENGVYVLSYVLRSQDKGVLHRNFLLYVIKDAPSKPNVVSFSPASYSDRNWSVMSKEVMDGLKVNGYGNGWFEYNVAIPETYTGKAAKLVFEASAKQLFGKDVNDGQDVSGDFMLGHGTVDHCKLPNSYAMTDLCYWDSEVEVTVNGQSLGVFPLEDDPADHRGVLSWNSQLHNRRLCEAGSYGYLIEAAIPEGLLKAGEDAVIRIGVPVGDVPQTGGGLAIYGKDFGRYPLDPSIVF